MTKTIPAVLVRQPFTYDSDKVSQETGLACLDVSRTSQEGKEDADINTIVRRFGLTGEMPMLTRLPLEGDFAVTSFQEAQNALLEAGKAFAALPADLRQRFNHDPGEFVAFCSDEANKDELKKLGLMRDPEPEFAPFKVEVVDNKPPAA